MLMAVVAGALFSMAVLAAVAALVFLVQVAM